MSSTLISTSPTVVLAPIDCADTAAATSGWIDVRTYEGDIAFIQATGVVTAGTIVGKIQDATAIDGTGAADISGMAFTSVGTASDNDVQKLVIRASATRGFVRYVGTIGTGPALVGVSMLARRDTV
jgi:hypothetical protein